jgi:trans-2,3-dihydro-3-hydroxyanthranilate isomerase
MQNPIYYILDVFAEKKYAGNQLAVFRNTGHPPKGIMQALAKEMNYSETTFIISDKQINGGYDVRIFTPEDEVPFAGHPTLGTAFLIQQEIIKEPVEQVNLNLAVGQIPVTFSYQNNKPELLWMKQKNPVFGDQFEKRHFAEMLSIQESDFDESFPIQEVSTGLPCFIVPLKTLEAVKRAQINRNYLLSFIEKTQAKMVLIFCPETYNKENQLNVRFFADYYGVPEDPATGSANGNLAGYLAKHHYFGTNVADIRVEQGYEIGRPSLLYHKSIDLGGEVEVNIGGKVIMTAKGELV